MASIIRCGFVVIVNNIHELNCVIAEESGVESECLGHLLPTYANKWYKYQSAQKFSPVDCVVLLWGRLIDSLVFKLLQRFCYYR